MGLFEDRRDEDFFLFEMDGAGMNGQNENDQLIQDEIDSGRWTKQDILEMFLLDEDELERFDTSSLLEDGEEF